MNFSMISNTFSTKFENGIIVTIQIVDATTNNYIPNNQGLSNMIGRISLEREVEDPFTKQLKIIKYRFNNTTEYFRALSPEEYLAILTKAEAGEYVFDAI